MKNFFSSGTCGSAAGPTPQIPPVPSSRRPAAYRFGGWLLALLLTTFAARVTNPVLLIQGTGNGGGDVTAFIDLVQIVQVSNGATIGGAVGNADFETPNVGAGSFQYNPTGGTWTFAGQSDISQTGGGFSPPRPPAMPRWPWCKARAIFSKP